jgi:hypothetical protein
MVKGLLPTLADMARVRSPAVTIASRCRNRWLDNRAA